MSEAGIGMSEAGIEISEAGTGMAEAGIGMSEAGGEVGASLDVKISCLALSCAAFISSGVIYCLNNMYYCSTSHMCQNYDKH